jgi:hypothetical protein
MANSPRNSSDMPTRQNNWLIGVVTIGGMITGIGALFAAFISFISGQWQAAGVCLIAAALAFGTLANAALRR